MKTPFLDAKFEGTRFSQHTMPLELARDLAVYEEMVLELARALYFERHPGRERVTKGFGESFALHLRTVSKGSAVLAIDRETGTESVAGLGPDDDLFAAARDLIEQAIQQVSESLPLPKSFPLELLSYFNRFGRSLREGENLRLGASGIFRANYTRAARKKLVLAVASEYSASADLRGSIFEVNDSQQTFQIRLPDRSTVTAEYRPALRDAVFNAIKEHKKSKALVRGTAVFDAADRVKRIEEVSHVELLEPTDVNARVEELVQLRDGWLDGFGEAPSIDGLRWFDSSFARLAPDSLPAPYLFPTPDGKLSAEWQFGFWQINAEIDFATHNATAIAIDTKTSKGEETVVSLDDADGWSELAAFVTRPR